MQSYTMSPSCLGTIHVCISKTNYSEYSEIIEITLVTPRHIYAFQWIVSNENYSVSKLQLVFFCHFL